jgi:hypothetical protein
MLSGATREYTLPNGPASAAATSLGAHHPMFLRSLRARCMRLLDGDPAEALLGLARGTRIVSQEPLCQPSGQRHLGCARRCSVFGHESEGSIPDLGGLGDVPERDRGRPAVSCRVLRRQVGRLQRAKVASNVDLGRVGLSHPSHGCRVLA